MPPAIVSGHSLVTFLVERILVERRPAGSPAGRRTRRVRRASEPVPEVPRQDGNAVSGKSVFRFETFGNEGFWTDPVRLPAGVKAAKVTPFQALELGLSIDVDALDSATKKMLAEQLKADPTGRTSTMLNDAAVTGKLFNAVKTIFPGDNPIVLAQRQPPLTRSWIRRTCSLTTKWQS